MNQPISTIAAGELPTPDELYEMATFIEDASTVACALRGSDIKENEIDSVLNFFEKALGMASEILVLGLDVNGGTFSKLKGAKKAS